MRSKIIWKLSSAFILVTALSLTTFYFDLPVTFSILTALTLASVTGFLFSRSLSRSIGQILLAAKKISDGDFSIQILPKTRDELGNLARSINTMADSLQRQREALAKESSQLKTILNGMIEGVLVTNFRQEVMLMNPAFRQMMHVDEESYGRTILECIRNEKIHEAISYVLREARPRKENISAFIDAEERFFVIHTAPFLEANEKIGSLSVFHDMTEIRKLEDIRREFVANVSHELKTPLTNIRGYAETLRTGASKDSEANIRFLKKIENNAIHLQELVEDILQLSQIESGRIEPLHQKLDLLSFFPLLLEEFKEQAHARSITFKESLAKNIPSLSTDPKVLSQIIRNLIDNAIRYTPEGGSVEISVQQTGPTIEMAVADTGIGISPENLPRVFERFYRVDQARTRGNGGTGLGLSIVKHLVQSLGGEIGVTSELGKGSRFYFSLPLI